MENLRRIKNPGHWSIILDGVGGLGRDWERNKNGDLRAVGFEQTKG
jgi:hypothetical protein